MDSNTFCLRSPQYPILDAIPNLSQSTNISNNWINIQTGYTELDYFCPWDSYILFCKLFMLFSPPLCHCLHLLYPFWSSLLHWVETWFHENRLHFKGISSSHSDFPVFRLGICVFCVLGHHEKSRGNGNRRLLHN